MGRLLTTLRFLAGLLAPGGVLVLAAWAVQREDVVQSAAAPYAAYFCFGALVAAVLLSWYYDQSRLLCCAAAVVLTVLALESLPTDSSMVKLAAVILLPWWTSGYLLSAIDGFRRPLSQGTLAPLGLNVWWIAGYAMQWAETGPWPLAEIVTIESFRAWAGLDPRLASRALLAAATLLNLWLLWRWLNRRFGLTGRYPEPREPAEASPPED